MSVVVHRISTTLASYFVENGAVFEPFMVRLNVLKEEDIQQPIFLLLFFLFFYDWNHRDGDGDGYLI